MDDCARLTREGREEEAEEWGGTGVYIRLEGSAKNASIRPSFMMVGLPRTPHT